MYKKQEEERKKKRKESEPLPRLRTNASGPFKSIAARDPLAARRREQTRMPIVRVQVRGVPRCRAGGEGGNDGSRK
jgi:hypothetical protein